jgi:hypothetical protein
VNISGRMQIQWINSGNQAFGFTIESVGGGLRQRESDRAVLWLSPPNFRCDLSCLYQQQLEDRQPSD